MSEACKSDLESSNTPCQSPEEAEVEQNRGRIAHLTVVQDDVNLSRMEREHANYMAQHPELWLSGF